MEVLQGVVGELAVRQQVVVASAASLALEVGWTLVVVAIVS